MADPIPYEGEPEAREKWRTLGLLAIAELMAMSVWFSASAVVPALKVEWQITSAAAAWLTMSVQLGFVIGALLSTLLNLADRVPARWLFALSAAIAAATTWLVTVIDDPTLAIALRLATGFFLAGVYPVAMKVVATWTRADRGLGIGLLVGAISIGSAAPHLLKAFGSVERWQSVLTTASLIAAAGAVLGMLVIREGPFRVIAPPFDMRYIGKIVRNREVLLANAGYLGHMWELYAAWTWLPAYMSVSLLADGWSEQAASVAAFSAIAAGGLGCLFAGRYADRIGRTTVTIASLAISGSCALTIGFFFGGNSFLLIAISLVWGFAVVADSAQFSAAVSELGDPEYVGTALTLQTCLGFLLTMATIRLIPTLQAWIGWQWCFSILALGPLVGIMAMWRLRQSPRAKLLAGGNR